jgi:hypothetical protein
LALLSNQTSYLRQIISDLTLRVRIPIASGTSESGEEYCPSSGLIVSSRPHRNKLSKLTLSILWFFNIGPIFYERLPLQLKTERNSWDQGATIDQERGRCTVSRIETGMQYLSQEFNDNDDESDSINTA